MIVVFDAQCLLCNGWVRFLLRHDKRGVLQFASIQGRSGSQLLSAAGLQVEGLQTLLVVDGQRSWQQTAAIFRILHALGGGWRASWLAWLIPAPLRDALYGFIARNRYWMFGRSETCMLPDERTRSRFLD
ncbi:conserved hypothetical protein [Burkholderiales bacterium 8X]|nr:conserved hypothetical protein [Burkholderiales bacterium 8X]